MSKIIPAIRIDFPARSRERGGRRTEDGRRRVERGSGSREQGAGRHSFTRRRGDAETRGQAESRNPLGMLGPWMKSRGQKLPASRFTHREINMGTSRIV